MFSGSAVIATVTRLGLSGWRVVSNYAVISFVVAGGIESWNTRLSGVFHRVVVNKATKRYKCISSTILGFKETIRLIDKIFSLINLYFVIFTFYNLRIAFEGIKKCRTTMQIEANQWSSPRKILWMFLRALSQELLIGPSISWTLNLWKCLVAMITLDTTVFVSFHNDNVNLSSTSIRVTISSYRV